MYATNSSSRRIESKAPQRFAEKDGIAAKAYAQTKEKFHRLEIEQFREVQLLQQVREVQSLHEKLHRLEIEQFR